jgi:hypothetical protein
MRQDSASEGFAVLAGERVRQLQAAQQIAEADLGGVTLDALSIRDVAARHLRRVASHYPARVAMLPCSYAIPTAT